jgi:hypothetical protein
MTTPNAIKRLSKRERKEVVRLLTAVEEESDGEIETLDELKELLVVDDSLLRNTESIKVSDGPSEPERSISEGDGVVM